MSKESQLRALADRVAQTTLASFNKRPLPVSAHQAAADLYFAVDAYTDAVVKNNHAKAKLLAEKLIVEAMRVALGYELPEVPAGVEYVQVEIKTNVKAGNKTPAKGQSARA